MKYNSRAEVEQIGVAGSYFEIVDGIPKARVLSSFWLYCDPDDLGFTPHMTVRGEGYWESWITTWMSQNVAPGSRCMDIGANMGYYSMFLASHGCQVHAIEPQPKLAELIQKSADENYFDHRVIVDALAVSDTNGMMNMIVPKGHGMNASLAYEPLAPNGFDEIEVPVITLDDCGSGFTFLKIDVEGAEDKLFQGAQDFIQRNPDCTWLLEWRWDRMEDPQQSANDIFEIMNVWWVGNFGEEIPLESPDQLAERQNEDWMLVLRKKT